MSTKSRILDGEDFEAFVKRCGPNPATISQLGAVVELLFKVGHAQRARIEALEAQVKVLESRPSVEYKGVYDSTQRYEAGHAVTCTGSLWIAKRATMLRPDEQGDGARDWQLAVKKGRDGRDKDRI